MNPSDSLASSSFGFSGGALSAEDDPSTMPDYGQVDYPTDPASGGGGLSRNEKIALGVGAVVAVGALVYFFGGR